VTDNTPDGSATPLGPDFGVERTRVGEVVVLAVRGDLDLATAPQLADAITAVLIDSSTKLIVDLSRVEFLASIGMSVLVEGQRAAGNSERFGVVASGPATGRPMELIGLGQMLSIYPTLDAATDNMR
jgi:anti-sigma B factor antagonist